MLQQSMSANHATASASPNTQTSRGEEPAEISESKVRQPLKLGWRRETIVKEMMRNGQVRGDVTYYSPCGKKLRTFQEIERFLARAANSSLSKDNFTFSSKPLVSPFSISLY
jgi:hypothetical protein